MKEEQQQLPKLEEQRGRRAAAPGQRPSCPWKSFLSARCLRDEAASAAAAVPRKSLGLFIVIVFVHSDQF